MVKRKTKAEMLSEIMAQAEELVAVGPLTREDVQELLHTNCDAREDLHAVIAIMEAAKLKRDKLTPDEPELRRANWEIRETLDAALDTLQATKRRMDFELAKRGQEL